MMNAGEVLDTIVHSVHVPDDVLAKPYLRPLYDEPEFVVRNIWRQFGGWWDGAPSRLKPAPDAALAIELAELAGGAERAHRPGGPPRRRSAISVSRATSPTWPDGPHRPMPAYTPLGP